MELLEQIWIILTQEPRYIRYAGYGLDVLGIIFIGIASLIRGPVGSRFSGKQAADGSGHQEPRPGDESKAIITSRKRWFISGVLLLIVGVVLKITAQEIAPRWLPIHGTCSYSARHYLRLGEISYFFNFK